MPNIHLDKKKVLAAIIIIVVLITASFWYYSQIPKWNSCTPEVSINVSYNSLSNDLNLNVASMVNKTLVFNQLIITDSKNSLLFTATLPSIELHSEENINFSTCIGEVVLNQGSGYNVEIISANGQKYSSFLILFEWIQVSKVSLSSPKTLLVEVHSLSNQTIVFDHAIVSQWQEREFTPGVKSLADIPITEGTLFPNELPPNENITFTVDLEKELSSGNYSLAILNYLPEYVRGGERVSFSIVDSGH
jgi:hypothetical protein